MSIPGAPRVAHRVGRFVASADRRRGQLCICSTRPQSTYKSGKVVQTDGATSAFDKADNEFTALAMNIFTNFGFQMVVATPLKSVMTLEPFIGGACFVDISDRRVSGVLLIEYDGDRQRLKLPEHAREEAGVEAS